ncbi:MAG: alpha/beta fold hydrolase [Pseudomonadota bacterium]|nr:alpha/beta fold hydrolase [Pseudomonadota bacterium]
MTQAGAPAGAAGVGKSVEAFGIRTNFHECGAGEPVVLLHGSGPGVSAWTNWRRVLPLLGEQFRVLAPDMAGFGFTERREDLTYDIKLWVKHLLGFMDALGLESAHLVGNSFGGSLALAAALRFPDRFGRLTLMGTPCGKFNMTPGLRAGWFYEPSIDNMRSVMSLFPFDQTIVTDELVRERYETSLIPGAQEGLRRLLMKPNEEGDTPLSGMPEEAVSHLKHRTLVMHGREDYVIPVELGLRLAATIPNADFHLFGRCGHWVQAERFDEFLELTTRHLRS